MLVKLVVYVASSAVENPGGDCGRKKISYSSVAGVFARLLCLHTTAAKVFVTKIVYRFSILFIEGKATERGLLTAVKNN